MIERKLSLSVFIFLILLRVLKLMLIINCNLIHFFLWVRRTMICIELCIAHCALIQLNNLLEPCAVPPLLYILYLDIKDSFPNRRVYLGRILFI